MLLTAGLRGLTIPSTDLSTVVEPGRDTRPLTSGSSLEDYLSGRGVALPRGTSALACIGVSHPNMDDTTGTVAAPVVALRIGEVDRTRRSCRVRAGAAPLCGRAARRRPRRTIYLRRYRRSRRRGERPGARLKPMFQRLACQGGPSWTGNDPGLSLCRPTSRWRPSSSLTRVAPGRSCDTTCCQASRGCRSF